MNRKTRIKKEGVLDFLALKSVRWFIGLLIMVGITSTVLNSYPEIKQFRYVFDVATIISAFIFTIEYILRIYSAPMLYPREKAWRSYLRYMVSFMGIIDFISILPFTIPYFFSDDELIKNAIEFGRIMVIFKVFRYSESYHTIQAVLFSIKYELVTSLSFVSIIVGISAVLMYYFENAAQPDKFHSIGEGVWWSVITFTSIGYGDIYPITPIGKFFAGSMALIGLIVFSLPTALVSGAYINYLQQSKEKQQKERDKIAGNDGD